MSTHGTPLSVFRNATRRARAYEDHMIKRQRTGPGDKVRYKKNRAHNAKARAAYEAAKAFNIANDVRPWENQRAAPFKGRARRSQKPVTLPTFKSE